MVQPTSVVKRWQAWGDGDYAAAMTVLTYIAGLSVATQTKPSLAAAIVNRSETCQCLLASSIIALTEFAGFV